MTRFGKIVFCILQQFHFSPLFFRHRVLPGFERLGSIQDDGRSPAGRQSNLSAVSCFSGMERRRLCVCLLTGLLAAVLPQQTEGEPATCHWHPGSAP